MPVRFAVNVPNFGDYADARLIRSLAADAEASGWDGFFVWDHIVAWDANPVGDVWVHLAAAATATERIRLGPMVAALPRRRPWVVARQAVALDRLSGGRVTLGVGLGEPPGEEFAVFGEETDPRVRAAKLDEGLAVMTGMWTGEPFSFEGEHYRVEERTFLPRPAQEPRLPIWVAGAWPNRRPFRRAARFEGVAALALRDGELAPPSPDDVRALVGYVAEHRGSAEPSTCRFPSRCWTRPRSRTSSARSRGPARPGARCRRTRSSASRSRGTETASARARPLAECSRGLPRRDQRWRLNQAPPGPR